MMHAVEPDGDELWTFAPDSTGNLQIYNAPLVDKRVVFFNVTDTSATYEADGLYAVDALSGTEPALWSYTPEAPTEPSDGYSEGESAPDTYSSPQFNLD